jgi:type I restriction enzyme S subunit
MSSETVLLPLSSVVRHDSPITYGVVKPGEEDPNGVAFIRSGDVSGGVIDPSALRTITDDVSKQYRRTLLEGGEILVSLVGTPGQAAIVPPSLAGANIARQVALVRVDPSHSTRYIFYCLTSKQGRESLLAHSRGSVQQVINLGDLQTVEIPVPPVAEQKAIAHILGTLDDKIELNRKTNETLEAMAKALFKLWFVDFDPVRAKAEGRSTGLPAEISDLFPDSFEDSELGEIPSGWQCCPFTQLVDVISGGTPKTSVDEYWNGSIPWFSVVDAPSGADCWVIQTEKSITHLGLDNCSSKLLPIGTTIISARGTVGKVCLTGQDMAMNQSCYGLRSKAANGEYFCFYLTKSLVEILEARAHGSVFSTITRDTLDGVSTISPPLEVIQSFNGIAGALLVKIKNNLEENRILSNQRDALLPKLISGEIRIPDAEKMLEEMLT